MSCAGGPDGVTHQDPFKYCNQRVCYPCDALQGEARRWGPGVGCVECGTWLLEDIVRFHVTRALLHIRAGLVQGRIGHLLSFDYSEL